MGAGIYRDSVSVGAPLPIKQPLLNGLVMGQDTVEVTPYRGKLYWFWGDTDRPSYPLGLFQTSGATSLLPGQGGLDPGMGVDLTYWVDAKTGFSKAMIPLQPGLGGPIWIAGLFTLKDANGQERLITHYSHLNGADKTAEHGLAIFNDEKAVFEKLKAYDLNASLSVFLGWLAKNLLTHYGGVDTYRKLTSAVLGLVLGDVTMILFWLIIDGWQGRTYHLLIPG